MYSQVRLVRTPVWSAPSLARVPVFLGVSPPWRGTYIPLAYIHTYVHSHACVCVCWIQRRQRRPARPRIRGDRAHIGDRVALVPRVHATSVYVARAASDASARASYLNRACRGIHTVYASAFHISVRTYTRARADVRVGTRYIGSESNCAAPRGMLYKGERRRGGAGRRVEEGGREERGWKRGEPCSSGRL